MNIEKNKTEENYIDMADVDRGDVFKLHPKESMNDYYMLTDEDKFVGLSSGTLFNQVISYKCLVLEHKLIIGD